MFKNKGISIQRMKKMITQNTQKSAMVNYHMWIGYILFIYIQSIKAVPQILNPKQTPEKTHYKIPLIWRWRIGKTNL